MSVTKASLADCLQDEIGISRAECKEFVDQFFGTINASILSTVDCRLALSKT